MRLSIDLPAATDINQVMPIVAEILKMGYKPERVHYILNNVTVDIPPDDNLHPELYSYLCEVEAYYQKI